MEGHFHLGLAHGIAFGLTLIVVGTLFRVFEAWGAGSNIPILQKVSAAMAFIY